AQEPVVQEDAGELIADGALDEEGDDRGVDAPRERAQHTLATDLGPDRVDRGIDEAGHRPRPAHPADGQEVVQDRPALRGMENLRVELDGVEPAAPARHRRDWAVMSFRDRREAL